MARITDPKTGKSIEFSVYWGNPKDWEDLTPSEQFLLGIEMSVKLKGMTDKEIVDLLLQVWGEQDILSPQSAIIGEAIDRLEGKNNDENRQEGS